MVRVQGETVSEGWEYYVGRLFVSSMNRMNEEPVSSD